MRSTLLAGFAFILIAVPIHAADSDPNPNHPGAVALGKDGDKWVYKSFPAFLPLYIFEGDEHGKSNCDAVCAAVWPIIRAPENAMPTGDWTVVQRADGRKQWAYKGKPVYTFYYDRPYEPKGEGRVVGWWLEEDFDGTPLPGVQPKPKSKTADKRPAWRLIEP
jgi:predicted lipoprotein with Yx(FWY)xxD motif